MPFAFEPHSAGNLAGRIRRAAAADPAELMNRDDAPVFRVRRGGVVYKMKATPELLIDHLLQVTEALGAPLPPGDVRPAAGSPVDTAAIPVDSRSRSTFSALSRRRSNPDDVRLTW
jgi:hypothetical protein